ncbi:hypothetical protein CHLRE_17g703350v5 [Chlamydomonas reinhardtii]|uniref:Uncharacterized protein n=1 Tax=Chlamydomonas reinhardtii TaxID=3055 RepID=A0A2K3CP28_CHLRE|nr:uncharacterized protein CHLRE_17g703350v5 [Chlamydomonas reinhardtii]PNW70044.1 hypothetical protein CHLRE_17g703350v5 [Chlamydomonas reinhardtii]
MADFGTRRSPASAVAPTSPIPPSRAASLTAPPAPLHPAVPPTLLLAALIAANSNFFVFLDSHLLLLFSVVSPWVSQP